MSTGFRADDRICNQDGCFSSCLRASLGKIAHLVGNDGKSQPRFSRAGSLHGCVERQNIRLERDLINDFVDLRNSVSRSIDFFHCGYHVAQQWRRCRKLILLAGYEIADRLCLSHVGCGHKTRLPCGTRDIFDGGHLLRRALCQRSTRRSDLRGTATDIVRHQRKFMNGEIQCVSMMSDAHPRCDRSERC